MPRPRVWVASKKILAIKRLHPRYSQDAEFIDMLIDEARITAQLVHSNIGQIFDLEWKTTTSSRWNSWMVRTFIGS